ncbi:MAG: MotA/TolQ/ExbB proton channel family protein [Pseudomonadota bacterium]
MLGELFEDFLFYYQAGGYVMPPLVVATLVLWYALGYRMSVLRRGRRPDLTTLLRHVSAGEDYKPRSLVDLAAVRGLAVVDRDPPDLRRHLDEVVAGLRREAGRFRIVTRAIVAVAPVVGLLGTVNGMIETFDSLQDMNLFAQSGGIAGGISQALFTTQMGLAVAIPGLVVDRLLARRQATVERELQRLREHLVAEATVMSGRRA